MTAASASWQMMMSGIPNINRFCFVLWRNFFIEIYIPIEPPMSETKNSVGSEIRLLPFSAFLLSEKAITKPMMFIIMKYAAANAAIGCCFKRSMDSPVILNTNKIQEKICAEILYIRDCRLDFFQILNGV